MRASGGYIKDFEIGFYYFLRGETKDLDKYMSLASSTA